MIATISPRFDCISILFRVLKIRVSFFSCFSRFCFDVEVILGVIISRSFDCFLILIRVSKNVFFFIFCYISLFAIFNVEVDVEATISL